MLKSRVRQVEYALAEFTSKPPPGRYAVVFQAVGNDESLLRGRQEPFEAASLIKLPILAELYRRAESGDLKLTEEMTFEERFRVGGSGSISKGEAGKRYRLDELARLMIVQSDNAATDMLLERLGMEAIEKNARAIGMTQTTVRRTIFDFAAIDEGLDNLVSAADVAAFFNGIATNRLPGSAKMREILEKQTRNEMIPAGLPKGTKIAHKTGELTGILHDAGIVSTPKGDYILVLLGTFDDREQGVSTWKQLSREVYGAFTR